MFYHYVGCSRALSGVAVFTVNMEKLKFMTGETLFFLLIHKNKLLLQAAFVPVPGFSAHQGSFKCKDGFYNKTEGWREEKQPRRRPRLIRRTFKRKLVF